MTETRSTGQEIQAEVLGAVRKSEEMLVDALKVWAEAVQSMTPSIPMPSLPYTDKLPRPQEFVASTYDFAEQLLISQRKFAESLLEAMKPLLGAGNGTAARKGATRVPPHARRARDPWPAAHLHVQLEAPGSLSRAASRPGLRARRAGRGSWRRNGSARRWLVTRMRASTAMAPSGRAITGLRSSSATCGRSSASRETRSRVSRSAPMSAAGWPR